MLLKEQNIMYIEPRRIVEKRKSPVTPFGDSYDLPSSHNFVSNLFFFFLC